jgi:hypothetical protein
VSISLYSRTVDCAANDIAVFQPPPKVNCAKNMLKYLAIAPGKLLNPTAMQSCEYCPLSSADQYIAEANI